MSAPSPPPRALDLACPSCRRLLLRWAPLASGGAVAVEVKCHRCGAIVRRVLVAPEGVAADPGELTAEERGGILFSG